MNVTLRRALSVRTLAGILALALALAMGAGSAEAKSSVVGPGESIQTAIDAADPGDTIVVSGLHREDVVIRKDGIKLRGTDNATLEPPARAGSPCSRVFGSEGICVLGDVNLETVELTGSRVSDVSISGFTVRGFKDTGIDVLGARDATVTGVRAIGNKNGMGTALSIGSKFLSNVVRGSGETAIGLESSRDVTIAKNDVEGSSDSAIFVGKGTNATIASNDLARNFIGMLILDSTGTKVLANDLSGGDFGVFVFDSHRGFFAANRVHDTCAGVLFFSGFPADSVGDYEVKGNHVTDNTRECPAEKGREAFSGIGIGLFGARDMEVTANHLSGNVPSGPTAVSGGIVVGVDPLFGGKKKPKNNTVSANHFGRNKPDIFWDKSGTGNVFRANYCNTSVPSRLCN